MTLEVRVTMPLTEMRLSTSLGLRSLMTLVSRRLYGLHCTARLVSTWQAGLASPARRTALQGCRAFKPGRACKAADLVMSLAFGP